MQLLVEDTLTLEVLRSESILWCTMGTVLATRPTVPEKPLALQTLTVTDAVPPGDRLTVLELAEIQKLKSGELDAATVTETLRETETELPLLPTTKSL